MQSLTYKDIIDEKIAEWQKGLKRLEQHAQSSSKTKELKSAINSAIAQLQALDAQETVNNTMETKDKIVKIFGSIDKNFSEFEDQTPFML